MAQTVAKQRIEYIDLAKGFCILLVVLSHILAFYRTSLPYDSVLKCFRMPLYFFLSGVFFKQYEGFWGFLKRKINKLVIPFTFFFITLGLVLPVLLYHFGVKILMYRPTYTLWQELQNAVVHEVFPDTAIWFLLCLFEVNIIFYVIYMVAQVARKWSAYVIATLSVICGLSGMLMSYCGYNLYCYLDTALTSMPFFAFGYILNRKTRVLYRGWRGDRYLWAAVLVSIPVLMWLAYPLDYRSNYFAGCYLTAHLCGVVGSLMTIFLAKMVGHIPIVTYWGRYSIMILCTHQIIYQLLDLVLRKFLPRGWWRISLCLMLTMAAYFVLIPLMKRYLPHVTAQKDVLPIR